MVTDSMEMPLQQFGEADCSNLIITKNKEKLFTAMSKLYSYAHANYHNRSTVIKPF